MRLALPLVLMGVAALAACTKAEPPPAPVRAVRTMVVATESAGASYEYAAEVRPRTESRLGFRVGGKVVKRAVNLGDAVKAGQLIAQLDPQDLRLGQEAANATLVAARVNLDQTSADFKRFKELRDQGFISSAELERRETAVKSAQAQYDQARAQFAVQGNQAGYASLNADVSGVITSVDAEPGMVVAGGTPIVRLAHDGPRDVVFNVPEDQVNRIKSLSVERLPLNVRMWGSSELIPARIREIAAAADPITRTFAVKADLPPASSSTLRLGQTATVLVALPRTAGVTKLPLSAFREEQGRTSVWLVDPSTMTVSSKPVQISGADGNEAVVAGGIAPGQIVVTAGVHVLSPGERVKFYADPTAPSTAGTSAATPVTVK